MVDVIKRSGRCQKFSSAKLARGIQKALREGRVSAAQSRRIAMEIAEDVARQEISLVQEPSPSFIL